LANPTRAIRTGDVWRRHFEASWARAPAAAREAAARAFTPVAEAFGRGHRGAIDGERRRHVDWLHERAVDITGGQLASTAQQTALFETASGPSTSESPWASIPDPVERLAAFASDRRQSPARRSEADGVLRIHRQRLADLDARLTLTRPEVIPLGALMLVPRGA
jgi:hypothetical protein